ncbi:MAG: uracil-DNA glycosylase [Pseudomonadota bacterium]
MNRPSRDCQLCPRLVEFRNESRNKEPDWHNGAVESFGAGNAQLLVIGLAPGLTGANRTGRPFTGDWAGDLLYETLDGFGFSEGSYDKRRDDGLQLIGARITNAVRCVPPQNKPNAFEINTCRPFLASEIASLGELKVLLCLGRISHDSTVRALGEKPSRLAFSHGSEHTVEIGGSSLTLLSSYHCSRYNTNTGRLTAEMFRRVFARAREIIDAH